jgi:hypothetical protein
MNSCAARDKHAYVDNDNLVVVTCLAPSAFVQCVEYTAFVIERDLRIKLNKVFCESALASKDMDDHAGKVEPDGYVARVGWIGVLLVTFLNAMTFSRVRESAVPVMPDSPNLEGDPGIIITQQ